MYINKNKEKIKIKFVHFIDFEMFDVDNMEIKRKDLGIILFVIRKLCL